MNVGELIANLSKYPHAARIVITWEGTFTEIDIDNIYQSPTGVVILDADGNAYKEEIISGERQVIR